MHHYRLFTSNCTAMSVTGRGLLAGCVLLLQMGKEVTVAPDVPDEDLPRLFPGGVEKVNMPSGIAYVRFTRDYGHAGECWDGGIV
jgi:hypothetical protein